jgi:hypothetical protein
MTRRSSQQSPGCPNLLLISLNNRGVMKVTVCEFSKLNFLVGKDFCQLKAMMICNALELQSGADLGRRKKDEI